MQHASARWVNVSNCLRGFVAPLTLPEEQGSSDKGLVLIKGRHHIVGAADASNSMVWESIHPFPSMLSPKRYIAWSSGKNSYLCKSGRTDGVCAAGKGCALGLGVLQARPYAGLWGWLPSGHSHCADLCAETGAPGCLPSSWSWQLAPDPAAAVASANIVIIASQYVIKLSGWRNIPLCRG